MPKQECPMFSLESHHEEYQCDQCEINEYDDDLTAAEARIAELETALKTALKFVPKSVAKRLAVQGGMK